MAKGKAFRWAQAIVFLVVLRAWSSHGARHRRPPLSSSLTPPELRSYGGFSSSGPDFFFEVSKPVGDANSRPCSALVLQHSFANTYSLPPAVASYSPPPKCGSNWDRVVLQWSGASRGRQYDRISAVWFGGVEFLRTCTAEPTSRGIYWEVRKDVTRYSSVLKNPQLLVVELANVVDSTYTGIFHINLTLEFYKSRHRKPISFSAEEAADLVLPISLSTPLSQGYWFQLSTDNETASKTFQVPTNVYRAVLEVCVSFHGDDEFWYTNYPNEYLEANNLSGYAGNGPFREVQVFLDGVIVGAVWPFPVIFTGGINPLFWRPAAAIGAFNLPSYDVELTPFVGLLVDGNNHTISMRVENAVGSWPVDANLHLWLDSKTSQTSGGLLSYVAPPLKILLTLDFEGLDGTFQTTAGRSISFSGYILCSLGDIYATASYSFSFDNVQILSNDSSVEIVTQAIVTKGEVIAKTPSKVVFSQERSSSFPLYLYSAVSYESGSSYTEVSNITHSFDELVSTVSPSTSTFSSLKNSQAAEGYMTVVGSTVTSGIGALQQQYEFDSTQGCYDRSLSTKNYTILLDLTDLSCSMYNVQ